MDALIDLIRVLLWLLFLMFCLMALPFVVAHMADTWNAPEYPHSGFCPDSPAAENSLLPSDY